MLVLNNISIFTF